MLNFRKKDVVLTRPELHHVPVPTELPQWKDGKPEKTFWQPVNHGELADLVVASTRNLGVHVEEERWVTVMDGAGLIGDLALAGSGSLDPEVFTNGVRTFGYFEAQFMGLHLLVRHSNNARWALQTMLSAKVLICKNGMTVDAFSAPPIRRKHSERLSLADYVRMAVSTCLRQSENLLEGKRRLEDIGLTLTEGDHLIAECAAQGLLPGRFCVDVIKEWREPRHPEFRAKNAWSLYNAITEISKARSAVSQADAFPRVYTILSRWGENGGSNGGEDLVLEGAQQVHALPPSSLAEANRETQERAKDSGAAWSPIEVVASQLGVDLEDDDQEEEEPDMESCWDHLLRG